MQNISTSLKHFNTDIGVLSATVQGFSSSTSVGKSTGFSQGSQTTTDLEDKLRLLEIKVKSLSTADTSTKESVRICGLTFDSPADLEAWQIKHTPASLPFGGFTDFFILLARVSTGHRSQSDTLKNMDLAKKLTLSAAECLIIGTFQNQLPSLLGRATTTYDAPGTRTTYLPALINTEYFENEAKMGGTRVVITDQLANVQGQIKENIQQSFRHHP